MDISRRSAGLAGTMFPFAIVTGEEYRIKNKTDYRGVVETQRLMLSACTTTGATMETENIALAPNPIPCR